MRFNLMIDRSDSWSKPGHEIDDETLEGPIWQTFNRKLGDEQEFFRLDLRDLVRGLVTPGLVGAVHGVLV